MSSTLKAKIQSDLNAARKERDKLRTLVLGTLLSEVKNREIDSGAPLDDEGVVAVVSKGIKLRKDAATQMRDAGREELAAQEDAQSVILAEYLPAGLTEDEVRAMIREAIAGGATQVGPLMGKIIPLLRGRFDGKEANRIAREELGG